MRFSKATIAAFLMASSFAHTCFSANEQCHKKDQAMSEFAEVDAFCQDRGRSLQNPKLREKLRQGVKDLKAKGTAEAVIAKDGLNATSFAVDIASEAKKLLQDRIDACQDAIENFYEYIDEVCPDVQSHFRTRLYNANEALQKIKATKIETDRVHAGSQKALQDHLDAAIGGETGGMPGVSDNWANTSSKKLQGYTAPKAEDFPDHPGQSISGQDYQRAMTAWNSANNSEDYYLGRTASASQRSHLPALPQNRQWIHVGYQKYKVASNL